jgi:tRNA A-37 threonylcarbamoyl transferase component Bud32
VYLIDCDSAEVYLRASGRIQPGESVRVRRLDGGVSNEVLYVERIESGLGDFVLKQARPQLRVADPWYCSVERIWREAETLRVCEEALRKSGGGRRDEIEVGVPRLLFEDRENYAFAMSAAPPHEVWKRQLLAGCVAPSTAAASGRLLAALHAGTWRHETVAISLADRSFFDDLRIDPYYRRIAQVHQDLQGPIVSLIESLANHRTCLVHGDFSPKNLLVHGQGLTLVDFEVGHYGDPAFDIGFFLSHLVLKAYWSGPRFEEYFHLTVAFWMAYRAGMAAAAEPGELRDLIARGVFNFAACMLARIDGKSKVEYLSESLRETVRQRAKKLLLDPPATWEAVHAELSSLA